jgi:hypothetical protein
VRATNFHKKKEEEYRFLRNPFETHVASWVLHRDRLLVSPTSFDAVDGPQVCLVIMHDAAMLPHTLAPTANKPKAMV